LAILVLATAVAQAAVPTSEAAVVGRFAKGPVDVAVTVNATEFGHLFGAGDPTAWPAEIQARQFFRNGGGSLAVVRVNPGLPLGEALRGSQTPPRLTGLGALLPLSNLGILICPEMTTLSNEAMEQCLERIEALGTGAPVFTVLDPPSSVTTVAEMITWRQANLPSDLAHAALYFPRLSVDPATWSGRSSADRVITGASGTMAAAIQKNDVNRAIWKSPAGLGVTLLIEGFETTLSSSAVETLNTSGINPLRDISPYGPVAWGARTLSGEGEDVYIVIARTRRWIHHSLARALSSEAALEENDSALWVGLQTRAESFLHSLFLSGAFVGNSSRDAYFVRCDSTTTTLDDIDNGLVNLLVGFSLVRPAEFTLETIQLASRDKLPNPPAVPLIVSPSFSDRIILSYPTIPGFDHSLSSSESMAPGTWLDPGQTAGDGAWRRVTVPTAASRHFFRVRMTNGL
jgi:hypothetical protein